MPLPARQFWVLLHRWAGLVIAGFLVVAGLTGSILPFDEELTRAGRPDLSVVTPSFPGMRPLSAVELGRRVERQTGGQVIFIAFDVPVDHVFTVYVSVTEAEGKTAFDTVWVDPYDGSIRLTYRYGELADGPQNIVPFLHELHYGAVFGSWGVLAFGVAALIWTVDCFVGFYLTLPIRKTGGKAGKSWGARWRPAWTVRKGVRGHKLNFDWHRASGLWLWPVLLIFAWSAVAFNLPAVHDPVMRLFGAREHAEPAGEALDRPFLTLDQAKAAGLALLDERAVEHGFRVLQEGDLYYDQSNGNYAYSARSNLDASYDDAETTVWFSGRDGAFVRLDLPLGEGGAEATVAWFNLLHMARVFGLPYKIFVSALGIATVLLSVTGVLIWSKKRTARLLAPRRQAAVK